MLETFVQIARALDVAHEAGIVHRDLKPDNVKIASDGTLKLIDFGIAKNSGGTSNPSPDAPTTPMSPMAVTAEGTFMGTPVYMSPEQARGQMVDQRTDIWSYGCCLYEALTGGLPFKGDTIADTVGNILKSEPDWSDIPVDTPQEIRSLLRRCLEKEARKRFSSAGDMAYVLEEYLERRRTLEHQPKSKPSAATKTSFNPIIIGVLVAVIGLLAAFIMTRDSNTPTTTQPMDGQQQAIIPSDAISSIAVLPLVNLSPRGEQDYFAESMTDAITAELANIKALKISGRTSAMKYKDTELGIPEIAKGAQS